MSKHAFADDALVVHERSVKAAKVPQDKAIAALLNHTMLFGYDPV
jgi:hypothetical protein